MIETAIGIDIGGTNTVFGIVDREGCCLSENSIRTDKFEDVNDFVKELSDNIRAIINSQTDISVTGIGIGAPNGNYYRGTIESAPNLKWKGIIPLADMIGKELALPAVLTNDANAAAIGEMIFGSAKGMKDFVVVTLGTGLGSGFVANGELIYGHDGFAGELGHTIIVNKGRQCGCGRKGCLEQYASATGIVITVKEFLKLSETPSVLRNSEDGSLTSKKIFEAAKLGDKIALEAFDYTARILGLSLANTVAITSPEAIILFGGLALAGEYLFEPTQKYMEENMLINYKNKVKLLPSKISGKNAAVLGASALVWKTVS
jgi:glucokinase